MTERIAQLRDEAEAAIAAAPASAQLEELRVRYLGRKAELPNILRGIATLPPEQRGPTGKAANQARQALEALIAQRAEELAGGELEARLERDVVDVTRPGAPPQPVGHLHLLTATRREIEDVFLGLGFRVLEGPEVETVEHNFDALNHSPTHPARARTDSFYTTDGAVLRTHTSPMQIRAMRKPRPRKTSSISRRVAVSRWWWPTGCGGAPGSVTSTRSVSKRRSSSPASSIRPRSSMSDSSVWRAWLAALPVGPRCSGGRSAIVRRALGSSALRPR